MLYNHATSPLFAEMLLGAALGGGRPRDQETLADTEPPASLLQGDQLALKMVTRS